MSNTTIGIGIRRQRKSLTLDVWYPMITREVTQELLETLGLDRNTVCQTEVLDKANLDALANDDSAASDELRSWVRYLLTMIVEHLGYGQHGNLNNGYADLDVVATVLNDDSQPVTSAEEAYLKLHLLSARFVKPHGVNTNGAFGALTNVAWTNQGPILPEDVDHIRMSSVFTQRPLNVTHVDKFPYMVNYVVPSGVRIASGNRVRLGAYLGEGSTVMPVGYVNFNAGTEGPSMIEGRVSAGVYVKKGSDLGGGASVMGTLSGGNDHVISIGENCLIGANAGTGISLGDGCTIAAGLYVYAGMKVALLNEKGQPVSLSGDVVEQGQHIVKAAALSGRDNMLFIQNSQTGELTCRPNHNVVTLNEALHSND